MQINMTTFAGRADRYIDATMTSLFASDWRGTNILINLIVGSEDESHVRQYAGHPLVRIVPWDVESHPNLRYNCTLNKIRALRCGDDERTVICEDDIVFAPDWLASLARATAELEGEEYVLSLFTAQPELAAAGFVEGKTRVKHYPFPHLQGAQALFYPSVAMRSTVADYLRDHLTEACGDELIGRCARHKAALHVTSELLVRHIGQISCFEP